MNVEPSAPNYSAVPTKSPRGDELDIESQERIVEEFGNNPNLYSHTEVNFEKLFNFSGIDADVQAHLQRVYLTLACAIAFCGVGSYFYLLTHFPPLICFFVALGLAVYIMLSAHKTQTPQLKALRFAAMMGCAAMQGTMIGALVEEVLNIDPNLLLYGIAITFAIFASFTGAAMLAKRRSYLYLGSVLFSGLNILFITVIVNVFFFHTAIGDVIWLYGGLAVFCGFIVYDTQLIVEKAHAGNRDSTLHAYELFVDFIAILVRVLVILKNSRSSRD
ncbi:hypothetical protein AKO1_013729 [Acrasis kona]|uniref:Bax inhibitor 1 n=1 Tax=Acrasis kona TaxID=1008807 RepID=A0AAW2ZKL9_9EUKA